jgi:sulfonate transport system ATP-binding protein
MKIVIDSLSFAYEGSAKVLNDLSFVIDHNKVIGVLGSSGCGKSTLLRLICGILPNSPRNIVEGKIEYDGRSSLQDLRSSGRIGLMFQEPSLLPNLTVEENVEFPLQILGSRRRDHSVGDLIQAVGLTQFKHFLPKRLSGGMQTRTALARTFVTRPDLLLLDEPFSALDYGWKTDLYSQLFQLTKTYSATVVLVSHDIHEVLLLADQVLLLSRDGRLVRSDPLPSQKPYSFRPDEVERYFESLKDEIVELQNHLLNDVSIAV